MVVGGTSYDSSFCFFFVKNVVKQTFVILHQHPKKSF